MCKKKDLRDFDSLYELVDYFATEETCQEYLATLRWNGKPECPYCQSDRVNLLKGKNKRYKCYGCKKQFSVRVGTIFHDSKLPLRKWYIAIYLFTAHKKGISSHQLAKDLKITQKTAWYVLQKIREAYTPNAEEILTNEVELDHTFIGGKEKNKHLSKRVKRKGVKRTNNKVPVIGIVERNGKVYALPVKDTKSATTYDMVARKVEKGAVIHTDEFTAFKSLGLNWEHRVVKHNAGEYVSGTTHTNNIENFWSHLKRGITGIYHHCSEEHLHRYINEFSFRYNNRKLTDGSKFDIVLANAGKRITNDEIKKTKRA